MICVLLQTDMASLRYEMQWKDGRIAELVATLERMERGEPAPAPLPTVEKECE